MTNNLSNLSTIKKIIRREMPGDKFAKARKVLKGMLQGHDFVGHSAELRQLAANPFSLIPATACNAIADEMDRFAKDRARTLATNAEITKAIKDGCPCCGRAIKRNLSLTGWWQCSQFGAVGFRAEADKPACNWQAFYVEIAS